jgi:hypothetical protein
MTKARSLSDFIESDGSVTLVDNQKIKVGTGNDLEIYHDGSNSYITESNATGNLFIKGTHIYLQNSSGQDALNLINGNVFLKSGGATKLQTTSTGVSVTGTITASGLVYPSSDGTNGQVLTTDGSGNLSFSTISGYTDSDVETYISNGTATPVFSNTEISGTIKLDGNYPTGTENVALGNGALSNLTSGVRNTAIGEIAGQNITEAGEATLVGRQAGANLTTGNSNTFIGGRAGLTATTGTENTAVGQASLYSMTTGSSNTALGRGALLSNTSASNNTAVGRNSLNANTEGTENVAVGEVALDANTTGSFNTAIGRHALSSSTTASNNTGVGRNALGDNTTGADNTAMGRNALDANTTGVNNVAIGESALSNATTASGNTAIGKDALAIATGGENTVVGKKAGDAIQAHVRNTIMGDTAGSAVNSSDNTFIGQNSGSAITSGDANTILGRYSGNEGGLDIRSSSNNIVLSDGDGNPRAFFNSSGNMGLGLTNGDAGNAKLVVAAQVASGDLPVLDFDGYGNRGDGASQSINFRMGRTGQATDQGAQIRSIFQGGGATAGQTSIGFEFRPISSDVVATTVRFSGTGQRIQFWSDELPHSNNPITNQAFVIGPSSSGAITSGLTTSTVLQNRSGELYAVDSSHNNTQITPHNWGLISSGPSEELAWTYYSQRPNPSNNEEIQTINVDIAKVVRKVEDLVGEKLIYTENSNMDSHTHKTIISDIQTALADLTTRIESLEG